MLRECPRRAGARRGIGAHADASETLRVCASTSAQPAKIHGLPHAFLPCTSRSSAPAPAARTPAATARPYCCKEYAPRERRSAVVDSRREENRRIFSADAADLEPVHRHYAPPIPVKAGSASSSYWAVIAPTAPTCSPIAFRPLPDGLRRSAPLGALCAPINWSYGSRSTS